MNAPKLSVRAVEGYEWPYVLRLPFRFGAVTHTHGRQLVVRARIRLADGREGWGYAAEALAAKWFEKDPGLTDAQNFAQLRRAVELTRDAYLAAGANTAFGLSIEHYRPLRQAGMREGLSPLVTSFGPAMVDRAVLDALCRLEGLSFRCAMQANRAGMTPHHEIGDLGGFDFESFLAGLDPADHIHVRHTVGMVDPIVAADQDKRVDDGLPETLEEVVTRYGCRYYKLKVGGDVERDVARLSRIAQVLDRISGPYHATLDGNEQYADAKGVAELWRAMARTKALRRLCDSILFIEQPIKRQAALSESVTALVAAKAVIIDESDGEYDSFPRARALGYGGVSSKACKGFYKSVVNRARVDLWNVGLARNRYFLSAEDLTTLAGLCVQQDLVLVGYLGLGHVERNGHHFVHGMSGRPRAEQDAFLAAHPDLYEPGSGTVRLRISGGRLALGSLDCPGFGSAVLPDIAAMDPMPKAAWPG
ncbi:MAG: mandelate racemase [Alphaproteobacteria bacterium]|nr:mandelate racemase [Alphaproteobacteria bacterium]